MATILIAGSDGLIGKSVVNHLDKPWNLVLEFDLPEARQPMEFYEIPPFDSFIDCARYDCLGDQRMTWQTVINHLKGRGGGRIILFSSIYGHKAPNFSIYHNTEIGETPLEYALWKGGTEQATRFLAQQLKHNIQVNCIAPGGVLDEHSEEFQDNYRLSGGARMIEPKNILPVIDMLLHPDNKVNGQIITVDGGWSL